VRVQSVQVANFKNLAQAQLDAHEELNIFLGDNGHGKTNLLEAIYLAATLQTLRRTDAQRNLIRFGEQEARIKARFAGGGAPLDIQVDITKQGKRARIGDKIIRDVSIIKREIGVVAFVPSDLALVREGPDARRRMLDRLCFALDPSYLACARRYEQTLSQRNRLLKMPRVDEQQLAAFTPGWCEAAAEMVQTRRKVLADITPIFSAKLSDIARGQLQADLRYLQNGVAEEGAYADALMDALARRRDDERRRKFTPVGPHVDDVVISLNEKRARHLASQGEGRALVLALKLAELALLSERKRVPPLLLLDDVTGELDERRAQAMFDTARALGAQIFVTAPARTGVLESSSAAVFELQSGAILRPAE